MTKKELYIMYRLARRGLGFNPKKALEWAKDDPFED